MLITWKWEQNPNGPMLDRAHEAMLEVLDQNSRLLSGPDGRGFAQFSVRAAEVAGITYEVFEIGVGLRGEKDTPFYWPGTLHGELQRGAVSDGSNCLEVRSPAYGRALQELLAAAERVCGGRMSLPVPAYG